MRNDELVRAETLLDLGRAAEAEPLLRSFLARAPESVDGLRLLTRSLLEQGRHLEALECARATVRAQPDETVGHQMHALALNRLGRHEEAVAAARRALHLAPHACEAHTILAATLLDDDCADPREALRHADEARRIAPHEATILVIRGVCLSRLGRRAQAEDSYRQALALDPGNAMALNNLAALDINRGRVTTASIRLTAALTGAPHEELLQRNLDAVLMKVIRWNYFLTLGGGVFLSGMAHAHEPTFRRAGVLGVVLALLAANLLRVLRHFPRGSRRWVLALARRVGGSARYLLFLALFAAANVVALGVLSPAAAAQFATQVDGFFIVGLVAGAFWTVVHKVRS